MTDKAYQWMDSISLSLCVVQFCVLSKGKPRAAHLAKVIFDTNCRLWMAGGQVERVTQTDESWGVDPLLREVEVSDWQQRRPARWPLTLEKRDKLLHMIQPTAK